MMAETAQHTPGPWSVTYEEIIDAGKSWAAPVITQADNNERLFVHVYGRSNEAMHDNAKHIVRCVNSHDALVQALADTLRDAEGYLRTHRSGPDAARRIRARCDAAHAAIATASEES